MCILFTYVDDKPSPNSYKVILAVNRDEFYTRPTKIADFWGTSPDILGGRDMEPGREGGTWLAISKSGRIGSLLNVLQSRQSFLSAGDRKGRGFLVNDLLNAPQVGTMDYLTDIYKRSAEYNPFTMVTIDVGKTSSCPPQICYYSSAADQKPQQLPVRIVHGIGNSFIATPFNKVRTGRQEFASVVQQCNDVQKKDELISAILKIMKNQQEYYPDSQMQNQAFDQPETLLRGISSRFIKMPTYGTRTHTIILIDAQNRVSYQEMTLKEPIDENNPEWITSKFDFEITNDLE